MYNKGLAIFNPAVGVVGEVKGSTNLEDLLMRGFKNYKFLLRGLKNFLIARLLYSGSFISNDI